MRTFGRRQHHAPQPSEVFNYFSTTLEEAFARIDDLSIHHQPDDPNRGCT